MPLARFSAVFFTSFLSLGSAFAAPAEPPRQPIALSTAAAAGAGSRTPGAALASAASRALDGGRYQEAVKLASEALKAEPGNKEAATVLHFAAGRAAAGSLEAAGTSPRRASSLSAETPPSSGGDVRPARLAVSVPKTGLSVPELPVDHEPRMYVAAGSQKPGVLLTLWNAAVFKIAEWNRLQRDSDRARLASLRAQLDRIETGRAVVASLGGWKEIDRKVDMRMADLPGGYGGVSIPLDKPDSAGHTAMLLVARDTGGDPDAVTVSILAHELSHAADFDKGARSSGLTIPSEFAAHRLQVHAFLELTARMTQAEKTAAAGGYDWDYSNFITALWVDHILDVKKSEFVNRFANRKIKEMASSAYDDLNAAIVAPGSPQLDYHLNAPIGGMYSTFSNEKDILDIAAKDRSEGKPLSAEERMELKLRAELMERVDAEDQAYRRTHGYVLSEAR